jgi:hypothetical protein
VNTLNPLTPEQENIINTHADEYIDFFVNNRKYCPDLLTLDDVKDDIAFLYEFVGAESPPKFIFFADSDLQEKLMFNFIVKGGLNSLIEGRTAKTESSEKVVNKLVSKQQIRSIRFLSKSPVKESTIIGYEVWSSVISSLDSQLRTNYPAADTTEKIRSNKSISCPSIEKKIQNDLNAELHIKDPDKVFFLTVWGIVWDKVKIPIERTIVTNIIRMIDNNTNHLILSDEGLTLYIPNTIGQYDMASYSFFIKTGILNSPVFERYYNFIRKGIWSVQMYADWCIVTQMPSHISRDSQGMLHSLDGPPVEWRVRGKRGNKEESYYIHGIKFDKELWEKTVSNKITIKEILKIQNMEQRQTVFSVISPQKFIDECGGKLISTHTQEKKGVEYMSKEAFDKIHHRPINLYKIENTRDLGLGGRPLYILLYTDPSTDRQYYMFVNPTNTTDAATAMAASLGLTREQYINITAES